MEKQILLPPAIQKEMDATFKLGRNALWRALTYRRNSPKARMLRAAALQRGGVLYTGAPAPDNYMPDVDTRFDHAAGVMYQKFGTRVELQVTRPGSGAKIFVDGEMIAAFDCLKMGDWRNVLYSLQQIYNELISNENDSKL